jgi:hypothetical protein
MDFFLNQLGSTIIELLPNSGAGGGRLVRERSAPLPQSEQLRKRKDLACSKGRGMAEQGLQRRHR